MVAQNTLRTYGVNMVFRFIEGIWLELDRVITKFLSEITYFTSYVRISETPFYMSTMIYIQTQSK